LSPEYSWLRSCANVCLSARIAANVAWVSKINKDKAKGKYAAWEGKGDDRDPAFTMVL